MSLMSDVRRNMLFGREEIGHQFDRLMSTMEDGGGGKKRDTGGLMACARGSSGKSG